MAETTNAWDFRADLEKAGLPADLNQIIGRRVVINEPDRRFVGTVVGIHFNACGCYDDAMLDLVVYHDGPRPKDVYRAWFLDRAGPARGWKGGPNLEHIALCLL